MRTKLFNENLTINSLDVSKFMRNGILIDTDILLILFIGEFDKNNNTNYLKELHAEELDFRFIHRFLNSLKKIKYIITPHIFHEFYKHIQAIFLEEDFKKFFKIFKDYIVSLEEKHIDKNKIINHHLFGTLEIGEHSLFMVGDSYDYFCIFSDTRIISDCLCSNSKCLTIFYKEDIKPIYLTNP